MSRDHVFVFELSVLSFSTIFLLEFGTVTTVWYFILLWRGKFSLKTGIFCKYPSQTWYICLITPNII
jgi:hypothetical protein